MAERRRSQIAGDQPLVRLVRAGSRVLEVVKLLQAVDLDKFIVATRVKSPDSAVDLVLLSLNMAGMNVFNGLLLVGVLPKFM